MTEIKCESCLNNRFHHGGSFISVANGEDDPYPYFYCLKEHWSCSPEEYYEEQEIDPWESCEDYEKS